MLYGATTMKEFKQKVKSYDEYRQHNVSGKGDAKRSNRRDGASNNGKPSADKSEKKSKCFLCGLGDHIATDCPTKAKGAKCFKCNNFGHKANECKTEKKDENPKVLCAKEEGTDMMNKTVKIQGAIVTALIDTGCDVNLIRSDAMKYIDSKYEEDTSFKLKAAGGKTIETLGSFETTVNIDENDFAAKFYVVASHQIPVLAIIGKELIASAEVLIKDQKITFKKPDKNDENYLLNITIDGLKDTSEEIPNEVKKMIENYEPSRGKKSNVELKLQLSDEEPVCHQPRRLACKEKEIVEDQVKEWLKDGVVKECASEYSSAVVVVKKKDGTSRVCVDYRALNKKIIKDRFPVPLIEDQLDALQESQVFNTLDLKNSYFHVPVNQESQKYLSFVTHSGQYTFLKTPFGCCNSPRAFQRYVNDVFRVLMNEKIVLIYVDDIIVPAKDGAEAIQRLQRVFDCARDAGLQIKWSKCQFMKRSVEFLGYIVENGRIKPSPAKTEAVQRFPEPTTIKQIQSFLGLTGYFRKFIEGYSTIARPMSDLLRKDSKFAFGMEQKGAFSALKTKLSENPVLKIFDQKAETELHTDASKYGFGAVLMQRNNDDQQWHPVYFMSTKTSPTEEKYDSYTLETLAVIKAVEKFHVYLLDKKFKIVTDCDAFTKTMEKRNIIPKIARWVMFLQSYDYVVEHRSGSKMGHVDSLSRNAILVISAEENLASKIGALQRDDEKLRHIFKILETQQYEDYTLKSGVLFKYNDGYEALVVPKAMEEEVIRVQHENGHFGAKKMEEQIKQQFYISSLKEKLKKCVKTCLKCILAENKCGKQEGFLHAIDKEDAPLQTFHIDHIGPMTVTCKMYKFIFVVTDAFSKFTWLFPTKSTTSREVLEKMKLMATTFGNPRRIISDKGSAFTSAEFESYCEEEGIEHVRTTTGMPRANGQVERVNRSLIPVLTKAAMDEPEKWYKHVSTVQQALNSTFHRSIANVPFKLLFGVAMRRKEDIKIGELLEENFRQQFLDERQQERDDARLQMLRVQQENQKGFNKRRRPAQSYKKGDLVAIKRTQFASGNKIATKYLGPYKITKAKNNERYDVEKVGHHEGPNKTSTGAEFIKTWSSPGVDEE